jgi:hypothetical protein
MTMHNSKTWGIILKETFLGEMSHFDLNVDKNWLFILVALIR